MKALTLWVLLAATAGMSAAMAQADAARGQLLYDNHCGGCHGTQMHWRDRKRVGDWASLVAEVRRWQATAHLAWSDDEVRDVARHLNGLYYRFEVPGTKVGAAPGPGTLR